MESELGAMQHELVQVQKEREVLEGQRRILKDLKAVVPPSASACAPLVSSGPIGLAKSS